MKDIISKFFLLLADLLAIAASLMLAYGLRHILDSAFAESFHESFMHYLTFPLIYIVVIAAFVYEAIYSRRYDFWHESRQIAKALALSLLIVLSILALTESVTHYSRAVILFAFVLMFLFVPLFKKITKKALFAMGLWQRKAKVLGSATFVKEEIFSNPYLGYVEAPSENAEIIFVNSYDYKPSELRDVINSEIDKHHEVIFIPVIREFDMTRSHIYKLSNAQVNLVVLKNRLKSRYRLVVKYVSDVVMTVMLFPLILPVFAYIAYRIKKEEPEGSIFYKQERMGKDGELFLCYKFRTMYEDGDAILKPYLEEHPEEVEYYAVYHKYENDPRITKIGGFLRRTSLDELPQIINVFRGEMSFIGPRPYMVNEKEKIGKDLETVLMVRPGITGLWQVSGRSGVDFRSRVKLDVWYIRNWNLWMNFVILLKTVRAVLFRDGAS